MSDLFAPQSNTAEISDCGQYRYRLTRHGLDGDTGRTCLFIMLNPSTADASQDDPTIRRCKHFAAREDCGNLIVVNLFAFRATKIPDMKAAAKPVGPDNDSRILAAHMEADLTIAAWGNHGSHLGRDREVMALLGSDPDVCCLGITGEGQPYHPLYRPNDQPLIRYATESGEGIR